MAISTYAELKQAIERWSKRTDITTMVDDFIDLAESDIWQRLRVRDMEARATASTTTTSRYVALPSDFLQMRKLKIDRSASNLPDVQLIFDAPISLRVVDHAGMPLSFAVTSQIEFDRVPDQVYTIEMQYFKFLPALSNSSTTNSVLSKFPMVYLYSALFHAAQWAHDSEMLERYALLAENAIQSANASDRKGRFGPSPGIKINGSTP